MSTQRLASLPIVSDAHSGLVEACASAARQPQALFRPPLARRCAVRMQLTGKTCIVTGANRGIGLEFVNQLLGKGNTVIAACRNPKAADALHKAAQGAGDRLRIQQLDVSSPESIERFAAGVKATLPHVDVLVNNAGVAKWSGLEEVTAQEVLDCFIPNAIGPLLVTQQLHKQGLLGGKSGGGSLVANVTSKMGSVSDNGMGAYYAYRMSKAALNIVNKSLSIDLAGDGVTCVLLHPGYVRTDMTDWEGSIDTAACVKGLLKVLESDRPLNGRWYDFKGEEIAW